MNNDFLSQDEINALIQQHNDTGSEVKDLSDVEKDVIGEVGNISMSTAATTLSSILNRQVLITTPRVSLETFKKIVDECAVPKVVANIEFKDGLTGDNFLMMDTGDALIIADLMMGGDGSNISREFGELELSAVGEAMNQMIGSASTSMATMLGRPIDILPPDVDVWNKSKNIDSDKLSEDNYVCKIAFKLSVEGLIESEIMQIFTMETVQEIINLMMGPSTVDETPKVESKPVEIIEERVEVVAPLQESIPTASVAPEERVSVQRPIFPSLADESSEPRQPRNLDLIMDVPLEFSVV